MAGSEKNSPKGGTQTKDRARLLLAFKQRGGSSVWFLMASKLPPKPLNSQEHSRCWLVGVGAVCQGGGAAGRRSWRRARLDGLQRCKGHGGALDQWVPA